MGDCIFDEDDYTLQYIWFNATIIKGTPKIQEPHLHDKLQYFTKAELEEMHTELSPNTQAYSKANRTYQKLSGGY